MPDALLRHRFLDPAAPGAPGDSLETGRAAREQLRLHLAQDGSATRLCETVVGGPVRLDVLHQTITDAVPEAVRAHLPGTRFIERTVSLVDAERATVMMDNHSWIALATVSADVREDLEAGRTPIGHLLERLWIRRRPVAAQADFTEALWRRAGLPDPSAVRSYVIHTPDGAVMLITECFRRGMLGWRNDPTDARAG